MLALSAALAAQPAAAAKCKKDAAPVGDACVDLYEASVWEIPPDARALIGKVRKSKIASADALSDATQRGLDFFDLSPGCPSTGNGCTGAYALSIAGVLPARYISWWQAAAACRNAGKRLATNLEWQLAALGTPDPGIDEGTTGCNVDSAEDVVPTGSRSGCVSDTGHFDMVGNASEWVADWAEKSGACANFGEGYGSDVVCMDGDGLGVGPTALIRGGSYGSEAGAGVFAMSSLIDFGALDQNARLYTGFRCARDL
jgi:formylglycine-generating enzyme required for sulfatase activity